MRKTEGFHFALAENAALANVGPQTLDSAELAKSGAEGSRTLDLCIANAALSQLSYRPRNPAF
jgi:hypothetical protein